MIVDHDLELAVTFEGGTGVTRVVSPEEVCFVTDAPLVAGQHLAGTLRFPAEEDEVGIAFRYVARITHAGPADGHGGVRVVKARFEQIDFVVPRGRPGPPERYDADGPKPGP